MRQFLIAAALCALSVVAMAQDTPKSRQMTGYISDSKCAASHNTKSPDEKCVSKCIQSGAKPVFVDAKQQVWTIDNPDTVSSAYGQQVTVAATSDPNTKNLHVIRLISTRKLKGSSGMMD